MSYSPLRSSNSGDGDSPVRAIYARNGARSVTQMMNGFDEPVGAAEKEEMPLLASKQQEFLNAIQHELAAQRHALHEMGRQLDAMQSMQAKRPVTPPLLPTTTSTDSSDIRQALALLSEQLREQHRTVQETRTQLDTLQRAMQTRNTVTAATDARYPQAVYDTPPGTIRTDTLILGSLVVVLILLVVCTLLLAILVSRRSAPAAITTAKPVTPPTPTLISS